MNRRNAVTRTRHDSNGYIPVADGFRVLCVLLVGWFHIWQQSWLTPEITLWKLHINLLPLVRTGYLMVDMMLLLSGFLLFIPYAKCLVEGAPMPDVTTFYKKRAARIVPSYYLCLVIMLIFHVIPAGGYPSFRYAFLDIASHLTFTHTLLYEGYIGTKLNGVLWTLAVEAQFYLIAPLIGRAFVKKPLITYLTMTAVAWIYRFVYVSGLSDTALTFNRLPAMLDVYANGMLAAWVFVLLKRRVKMNALTYLASAALLILSAAGVWYIARAQATRYDGEVIRAGQMLFRYPLTVCGAVFLVSGSQAPRFIQLLMGNRVTRFLSGVSYNFYIWHSIIALRLREWHIPPYSSDMPQKAGERPWMTQYTWLCFFAALVFATFVTYLWEKPCARRILQGSWRKGKHNKKHRALWKMKRSV
ncbi:MAG: acyltransferase [Clostridia bacterium]|nr:acyltransferase [Clostridia bacterium]